MIDEILLIIGCIAILVLGVCSFINSRKATFKVNGVYLIQTLRKAGYKSEIKGTRIEPT